MRLNLVVSGTLFLLSQESWPLRADYHELNGDSEEAKGVEVHQGLGVKEGSICGGSVVRCAK